MFARIPAGSGLYADGRGEHVRGGSVEGEDQKAKGRTGVQGQLEWTD